MSRLWTQKRQKACRRDTSGRFKTWRGGYTKTQLPKQRNSFQGISVHIGNEFRRQRGRIANIGDIVRTKTQGGEYHKQAQWYVRTPDGWRKSGQYRKPGASTIRRIIQRSRRGR